MATPPGAGSAEGRRRVWTTRRAVVAHVALAVWVPGCAVACWWQVGIALSGDSLGWIYSVMWPCFAVFATIFWWHFLHDDPDTLGRRGLKRVQSTAAGGDVVDRELGALAIREAEADDPELAEYNAYLAALARDDRRGSRRR
ncbi:MAG: hypothetical protein ABSG81_09690 [Acidimicrobiales bacterium]